MTLAGGDNCVVFSLAEPGSTVTLQVRVWDFSQFPTYEAAVGNGKTGASTPFGYTIPPPGSAPVDVCMEGLRAFALVAPGEVSCPGVFAIANNPATAESTFFPGASSGSNYLVSMLADTNITAQLVSSNGALAGSALTLGGSRAFPRAAFGNTNYLVAWSDEFLTSEVHTFGQFISPGGIKVGSPFPLATNDSLEIQGLAFDGINFLAILADEMSGERRFYGQLVSSAATLSGPAFLISDQQGNGANPAVAFGRTNYLVAWQSTEGIDANSNHTFGAFVSIEGSVSAPFRISESASLDGNPLAVGFDHTNYFVVWNKDTQRDSNGSPLDFHLYGRIISPAGIFQGDEVALVNNPGNQRFPNLGFDGVNYLLSWSDQLGTASSAIKHQFFTGAGQSMGVQFSVFTTQSSSRPYLGGTVFGGNQFLAVGNLGTPTLTNLAYTTSDVYGKLIPSSIAPPKLTIVGLSSNGQFGFALTGTPGINYAILAATNVVCGPYLPCLVAPCPPPICAARWSTVFTTNSPCGSIDIIDPDSPVFSHRIYRVVKE